jgi:hypothetical protein
MKQQEPPHHTAPEAVDHGAPRVSPPEAKIESTLRPLPAMVHHDPHPKRRETLHLRSSAASRGTDATATKGPTDEDVDMKLGAH